jgi:hypothetical protein
MHSRDERIILELSFLDRVEFGGPNRGQGTRGMT